jgi:hypothetical protein
MEDMKKAFLKSILNKKYDYYKVYVHNLSYFDSVFIIDVLSQLGDVKPIKRENAILKLTLKFNIKNTKSICTLAFYDSYLILPASLRNLSNSFSVENKKDHFPYGFLNTNDLNIDYKSNVPEYKYFLNTLSEKEYKEYCNRYKGKL